MSLTQWASITLKMVISEGCCNADWATTEIHSLVLEARSPEPRCRQGHTPSETRGRTLPSSSWLLGFLAVLGLQLPHSRLCLGGHMALSLGVCLFTRCFLLPVGKPVTLD